MKNAKNIAFYSIFAGLFFIPFIAFIVPQAMFFPFITGKGFAFRILVEILFGLYIFLAFISPEYRPKLSWITKSVLFFGLAILVADLLGVSVYKSLWSNYERMEGFVLIIHLVMYYIVASSVFKTASQWRRFFDVSVIASVIMSFYGLLQLLGKLTINQGGVRLDGTFGNASYFAIYLVFHIFLCIYFLSDFSKPKWQRYAYSLAILFQTWILYFTATRGAILGLIGGLFISAVLIAWKEKENLQLRKTAKWIVGVVFILVLGFLALRSTSLVKKSPVLSRFSNLSFTEFQGQGRYFVWPMALKGFVEHPILGWGQENFNFVFNKNYNPGMFGQEEWFDRTHNIVLDWLIAGGLIGLLAYVSMYVALFYYVWRRDSTLKLSERSIFTGMIVAYVFHNLFVFDNLISYILFFSLLAYIHAISVSRDGTNITTQKTFSETGSLYAVLPIVFIATVGAIYFVNIPAIKANQTLIQSIQPQKEGVEKNLALFKEVYAYNSFGSTEAVEQLILIVSQINSSPQISNSIKKDFYDFGTEKINQKVTESPHDARYLMFAGSFYNRFGNYDEAIKYLDRALVESPLKQSIYFELGTSYIGKKDYNKMFELFKKAYDLKPDSPEAQIIYAVGALYTKNTEVLKEMSPKIENSIIVNDNRILTAYATIGDYNTVIAILNARIEKDPKNKQYKLSLASAYVAIMQKQKAIDVINGMIKDDPSFKDEGEGYIKQIQNS